MLKVKRKTKAKIRRKRNKDIGIPTLHNIGAWGFLYIC